MVNEFGSVSYPLRNSEMELTAVTGGPFAVNSRGVGREKRAGIAYVGAIKSRPNADLKLHTVHQDYYWIA